MHPMGASGQSIPETSTLCRCAAANALFAFILFCTPPKKKGIVLIIVFLLDGAID